MLPSVLPRLATDSAVRVFLGAWKLLSFISLPSWDGAPSLPLLSLFLSFIFFLPPFEDNGLLFWVPDVLCRHSEVVLWYLLRAQMFFWWIFWGESGLPILFLHHLRTASLLKILIPTCDSPCLAFHVMYSTYKLNKQGDNIQPCCTPFPVLNQSVPFPVLTCASWPAHRFLRRQVKWFGTPICLRIFLTSKS